MMARRAFGGIMLAAIGVLLVTGCGDDAFPDYSYKMTIYVGDTAFSSVRRVEQGRVQSMVDSAGVRVERKLTGEAVILNVNGRNYYALLNKPDNADYATLIAGAALAPYIEGVGPQSGTSKAVAEYRKDKQRANDPNYYLDDMAARSSAMTNVVGPKDLPRTLPARPGRPPFQAWPMFVTFDDPKDPRTVREVTASSIGVSQITIEITDEDVPTGIERQFPWWDRYNGRRFDGSSEIMQDMTISDVRNWLTTGQFSTGVEE